MIFEYAHNLDYLLKKPHLIDEDKYDLVKIFVAAQTQISFLTLTQYTASKAETITDGNSTFFVIQRRDTYQSGASVLQSGQFGVSDINSNILTSPLGGGSGRSSAGTDYVILFYNDTADDGDKGTRGGLIDTVNAIRGVMIPAGTSSVYDQTVGQSMKRPFLHVRYRASQTDDRRLKTWVTGSVGAATSALDVMQLHFLTERCLITQGANNFMLMK